MGRKSSRRLGDLRRSQPLRNAVTATRDHSIDFEVTRDELREAEKEWDIIFDALEGETAIKKRREKYLPMPEGNENDPAKTISRYEAYLTRAVYFNMTAPTRNALVGQIFLRSPEVKLPTVMEKMEENANGEGLTLEQLIRQAANNVLPYGRAGILADFPVTDGEVTKAELDSGEALPVIKFYDPWSIRNWQYKTVGKRKKLVFLMLREYYEYQDEKTWKVSLKKRYRVYRLKDDKECWCDVYSEGADGKYLPDSSLSITDKNAKPLDRIPFEFIGSENNDAEIDKAPFSDFAKLNIGHFRNSADYEESVFLLGQPTLLLVGLKEEWLTHHLPKGIAIGSRNAIPLNEGADGKLLQALPNTLAFEAMTHKEEQMIASGAKIIQARHTVERKEAEIEVESASQKSQLMIIRDNLQLAFTQALKLCALFVADSDEGIELELNDNFDLTSMTAEEIRYTSELCDKHHIAESELRRILKRSGIADLSLEAFLAEAKKDKAFRDEMMPAAEREALDIQKTAAQNKTNNQPPNK